MEKETKTTYPESGLNDYEIELEKVVEDIKFSDTTLEGIAVLKKYLERASAERPDESSGLHLHSVRFMCPKCNQPYITYTADEYYECHSCDYTWS